MKTPTTPPYAPGLINKLADFQRRLKRLADAVSRLEDRLYHICDDLTELLEASGLALSTGKKSSKPPSRTGGATEEERLKREALEGVGLIEWNPLPDGCAEVEFDHQGKIGLSEELSVLLALLIEDNGTGTEKLVPWKTKAQLAAGLKARMDKPFSDAAVLELIYRLREQLELFGVNRWLVMGERRYGYRFALRRGPKNVLFANHKSFSE